MFRLHIDDSFEQLEKSIPDEIFFPDTLGGFDVNLQNQYLLKLNSIAQNQNKVVKVYISYPVDDSIQKFYTNLNLTFEPIEDFLNLFNQLHDYNVHPNTNIKNFVTTVEKLLDDNDIKLKYNRLLETHNRIMETQLERYNELEKKYMELKLSLTNV
jgi:hypothetical protein